MAFLLLMNRRAFAQSDFKAIDSFLQAQVGSHEFKRMNCILKYKMDEMSMRVRVATESEDEYAISKLLQIIPSWAMM